MLRQESERFKVPEGTFVFLETSFTGPKGEAKRRAQFMGDPVRVESKIFGGGKVRLNREIGGLRVTIMDGDPVIMYEFILNQSDVLSPSNLGLQMMLGEDVYVFPSEAAIERGLPLPEMNQDKVDELFGLARQTITLSH